MTPDSPTQRVGAPPSEKFTKVDHLAPMGSLEKVTTDEALGKWADDVRKRLDSDEPVAYVIEPKIDGSAVSLVYEEGQFVRGATRGDGFRGRGDHGQPEDDPVDSALAPPAARGSAAAGGGGARRGLLSAVRVPGAEREARLGGQENRAPTRAMLRRGRCASSTRRSPPRGRSRSGSTARATARQSRSRRSGSCSSGCESAASARTRTRSASRRSRRSLRPAGPGRRGGSTWTTRSTGS